MEQRQTQKRRQGRVPGGKPATARISARRVGNDRRAATHDAAEQRIKVMELEAPCADALVHRVRLLAPGDIAQAMHAQERQALVVSQDLADEAVLALRQHQQMTEHRLEGAVSRPADEKALLQTGEHGQHRGLPLQAPGESFNRLMRGHRACVCSIQARQISS